MPSGPEAFWFLRQAIWVRISLTKIKPYTGISGIFRLTVRLHRRTDFSKVVRQTSLWVNRWALRISSLSSSASSLFEITRLSTLRSAGILQFRLLRFFVSLHIFVWRGSTSEISPRLRWNSSFTCELISRKTPENADWRSFGVIFLSEALIRSTRNKKLGITAQVSNTSEFSCPSLNLLIYLQRKGKSLKFNVQLTHRYACCWLLQGVKALFSAERLTEADANACNM